MTAEVSRIRENLDKLANMSPESVQMRPVQMLAERQARAHVSTTAQFVLLV